MTIPSAFRIGALPLALAGIFGGGLWLQLRSVLHHDPAWLIHGTEVFLSGGTLYRDVFELNPPLIFYLTVPPVWIARCLDLFTIDVFVVYVYTLIAVCLVLSRTVLSRALPPSWRFRHVFLLAVAGVLIIMPAERFGQREHLMVTLSLPYALLLAMRARQLTAARTLSLTIGILAALGFALKPYFLLAPAGIELYLALHGRTLRRCIRPETIALAATGLLYFASIFVFTPDYLTTIVPFTVEVYDRGYGSPLSHVLARPESILLPVILAAHAATRRHQTIPELGDVLAIAAAGFFAAYVIQMKGWSYHIYPLDAALQLLLVSVFVQSLRQAAMPPPHRQLRAALGGLLAVMTAGAGVQRVLSDVRTTSSFMTDMAPFVRGLPRGTFISVFSAGVFNGFPLVNYHRLGWASRFDTFWLLPGLIDHPDRSGKIERFLRDAVVADLIRHPPQLVFVDAGPVRYRFKAPDFDYVTYFSADPRFRAIWANYREIARVNEFEIYLRSAPGGLR